MLHPIPRLIFATDSDMNRTRSVTFLTYEEYLNIGGITGYGNYDVSKEQDGSITAWYELDASSSLERNWYIAPTASNITIAADEDCTFMFGTYSQEDWTYSGFQAIYNFELVDMKNVKYVDNMFLNCKYLEGSITLKNFNPNMSYSAFEQLGYSSNGVTIYSYGGTAAIIQDMLNSCFNNVMYGGERTEL